MEKETLEEAAEKDFNILQKENLIVPDNHIWPFKLGYLKGAKWQQENSNVNALHFEIDALKRLVKVLEHQQERTYSEEQVIELLEYTRENFYDTGTKWHEEPYKDLTSKELLEQFKKK